MIAGLGCVERKKEPFSLDRSVWCLVVSFDIGTWPYMVRAPPERPEEFGFSYQAHAGEPSCEGKGGGDRRQLSITWRQLPHFRTNPGNLPGWGSRNIDFFFRLNRDPASMCCAPGGLKEVQLPAHSRLCPKRISKLNHHDACPKSS